MTFFNLRHDKGLGDRENQVHCNPLGSPGTPLVGLHRGSMESNFDASQVPRLKTWQPQSRHATSALKRKGSYLPKGSYLLKGCFPVGEF